MTLSESELILIDEVMAQESNLIDWADTRLRVLKKKIKRRLRNLQREKCCYCLCNTHETGSGALDIEHVLPKGYPVGGMPKPFLRLMLENENLAVACKRCNTSIKRTRVDFLNGLDLDKDRWKNPSQYKIIHPRFEIISDFLRRYGADEPGVLILKFSLKTDSEKARFHYDYFELSSIEIQQIDSEQGIDCLPHYLQDTVRRLNELQTF